MGGGLRGCLSLTAAWGAPPLRPLPSCLTFCFLSFFPSSASCQPPSFTCRKMMHNMPQLTSAHMSQARVQAGRRHLFKSCGRISGVVRVGYGEGNTCSGHRPPRLHRVTAPNPALPIIHRSLCFAFPPPTPTHPLCIHNPPSLPAHVCACRS